MSERMRYTAALVGIAAVMAAISWGRWVNPIVDVGRELYVPWQLQRGAVLYRDIAYFNGPLSPYFNAFWFSLFGAHLNTLLAVNAVLLALITAALFTLVARLSDELTAFVTSAFFLVAVAFSNLAPQGNYSYLLPYSHEITHGFLLLLVGFGLAVRLSTEKSKTLSFLLGFTVGLALLTKVEICASLLVGVTAQLFLARLLGHDGPAKPAVAVGVAVPLAVAVLTLASQLGLPEALSKVLHGIAPPNAVEVSNLYFYRRMAGFEDVGARLNGIAASGLLPLGLLGAWWSYGRLQRDPGRRSLWLFGAIVASAAFTVLLTQYRGMFALVPVVAVLTVIAGLWTVTRWQLPDERRLAAATRCSFALLALVLMWKKILNVQIFYYGFVLAIPGIVLYFSALLSWIPDAIGRHGRDGRAFRAAALGAVAAMSVLMFLAVCHKRSNYTEPFHGPNAGLYLPQTKHEFLAELTSELSALGDRHSTMAVFPEGALLNFMAEYSNPSPHIVLLPIEVTMFGEERILESYRSAKPEIIVWLNRDLKYYGYRSFGTDYGLPLASWITHRYRLHREVGQYENDSGMWAAKIFVRAADNEESGVADADASTDPYSLESSRVNDPRSKAKAGWSKSEDTVDGRSQVHRPGRSATSLRDSGPTALRDSRQIRGESG